MLAHDDSQPVASKRIAILVPCHNEELTVVEVVNDFRAELPQAEIFVFDNNSTDRTVERATAAGATIVSEPRQGKGFVVQSMFRRVEADIYVMVDGDGTYPASEVQRLIDPILKDEADMVVGSRLQANTGSEFRSINRWANRLVLRILNSMFRVKLTDILSGYRAFNRKFVKTIPVFGGGFEIETELTIKAVARGFRIVEIPTRLTSRPAGSHSKIRFLRDGFLILNTILALFRDYKPLTFFGTTGLLLVLIALVLGGLTAFDFLHHGVVTNISWAVLAVGIGLTGMMISIAGFILHTIVRRFQEIEHTLQLWADEMNRESRSPAAQFGRRDEL
jgi:glycosyltransferase involved in cell wall biosynthesis